MNLSNAENNNKIIDHSVLCSPNDTNEYYYDVLPNNLRYILISNKGEINQIWIREKDIDTYDNNSMFVKAVNEYQEDKD